MRAVAQYPTLLPHVLFKYLASWEWVWAINRAEHRVLLSAQNVHTQWDNNGLFIGALSLYTTHITHVTFYDSRHTRTLLSRNHQKSKFRVLPCKGSLTSHVL